MQTRVFALYLAIVASAAACSVFGTPKVNTPCGVCEPITVMGQTYDVCAKPAELQRLRAALRANKVGQ